MKAAAARSPLKEARFLAKIRKKLGLPREASMARIVARIGELRAVAKIGPADSPADTRALLNLVDSLLIVSNGVRRWHAPDPIEMTPAMHALKAANSIPPIARPAA